MEKTSEEMRPHMKMGIANSGRRSGINAVTVRAMIVVVVIVHDDNIDKLDILHSESADLRQVPHLYMLM